MHFQQTIALVHLSLFFPISFIYRVILLLSPWTSTVMHVRACNRRSRKIIDDDYCSYYYDDDDVLYSLTNIVS